MLKCDFREYKYTHTQHQMSLLNR